MRTASLFVVGVALGCVATAVILGHAPPEENLETSPIIEPKSREPAEAAPAKAVPKPAVHPEAEPLIRVARASAEPQQEAEWTALVEDMLEREVARHLGRKIAPLTKSRLLTELARLRDASLGLQETPLEPHDPEQLRERVAHQVALLDADRAFREELGLGVAEFLQGLDVGAVEDVSDSLPAR